MASLDDGVRILVPHCLPSPRRLTFFPLPNFDVSWLAAQPIYRSFLLPPIACCSIAAVDDVGGIDACRYLLLMRSRMRRGIVDGKEGSGLAWLGLLDSTSAPPLESTSTLEAHERSPAPGARFRTPAAASYIITPPQPTSNRHNYISLLDRLSQLL